MAESATTEEPTPVTIFGRTYRLRGGDDADHIAGLAALVDGKMREVERATGTADTLKIAILASLNLADDYVRACRDATPSGKRRRKRADGTNDKRLARLVALLDDALAE